MPKATLTFNLPDEQYEYKCATNATAWKSIVYEMDMFLRNAVKYGHNYKTADEVFSEIRKKLYEYCNDEGLDPWES